MNAKPSCLGYFALFFICPGSICMRLFGGIHSRHFPKFQLFTFLMHNCIWGTLKLLWLLWADAPLPHIQIGWEPSVGVVTFGACSFESAQRPLNSKRCGLQLPWCSAPTRVTFPQGVLSCSVVRNEEGRALVVCGGWANGNGWRNTNHRPSSASHAHNPLTNTRPEVCHDC